MSTKHKKTAKKKAIGPESTDAASSDNLSSSEHVSIATEEPLVFETSMDNL